jgi:hypothetical protein
MDINDLVQALEPEFPACMAATLLDNLRWSQRELCEDGNAWVVNDGPVVFGADTPFATVEPPLDAEAVRLISLTRKGRKLRAGADYTQSGDNLVTFNIPIDTPEIEGQLSCKPEIGKDLPDELLSRWFEALLDGARARLMVLPQPWRDLQMAQYYQLKFAHHKAQARERAMTGHQAGSVRMRVPRFF